MDPGIEAMQESDLEQSLRLWVATEGVGLNESDTVPNLKKFLRRNPGMSLVARAESRAVVGAVLCGHDGRRGYLNHLAVARSHRGNGLGTLLVRQCLESLRGEGILKCNVYVYDCNAAGRAFWTHLGWTVRSGFHMMQRDVTLDLALAGLLCGEERAS